jgi:hypothetical protein
MSNRWQKTLTMSCAVLAIAGGAAACAVSPDEPQGMDGVGRTPLGETASPPPQAEAVGLCNQGDPHEKNDQASDATDLTYASTYDGYSRTPNVSASICKNDEDWYHIPTADLPYTVRWVPIRVIAAGASFCPEFTWGDDEGTYTEGYDPPAGPENTVQVDVYNAATLQLVGSKQSNIGRVFLDIWGGPLNDDLYLRIHGPKEAQYGYWFNVRVQDDAFEDECEN